MLNYSLVLTVVAAVFFWNAAMREKESGIIWAGVSLVVSALIMALGGGFLVLVLGQVAVFAGITVFRTIKDNNGGD
ncbi:MAG: hypothetical protein SF172_05910 [Burkholderiales bacterium]|nr:hypothetical protein [Burkholderiales bacterium]